MQIFEKMGTLSLTLLLSVGLIFALATALLTNKDIGDCPEATAHDRLTDIVEPLKYNIKLNVRHHYKNIIGESHVRIRIAKTTRVIALHAHGLQIPDDEVVLTKSNKTWAEDEKNGNGKNGNGKNGNGENGNGENGNGKNGNGENGNGENSNGENGNGVNGNGDIVVDIYKPQKYRYCAASQILEIHFEEDLHRGYYVLHIPFITPFGEFKGFIQYPYFKDETDTRWLLTTFIESNEARKVFPCWDEMAMKAFFNISVEHSSDYIAFSNSPIRRVEKEDLIDIHITHFRSTAAISPSLVMITLINNVINHPGEFATDFVWHREEATDSLRYARSIIETVRQYLSLTTNVQEKKRKTNLIMIPNSPMKAIGCCGLYLYREQDLTYDKNIDFSGRKVAIARLLAHRISRRWFLGVVSPSWRTDMWLGEALATHFSHYTVAKMTQNARYIDLFVVQTLQPMLQYDTELKMQSIAEVAKSTAEIDANEIDTILYCRLNYNRGSILIRMLQKLLGEASFRKGIDRYVRKYKSSSATTDDFWQTMQRAFDKSDRKDFSLMYDIKNMMDTWLTIRRHPVVHFKYNYIASMATITVSCDNDDSDLIIPVSYTMWSNFAKKKTVHHRKFKCSQSKHVHGFQLEDMLLIHRNQAGFYRVNYDNKSWRKISSHLRYENHTNIHVLDRAGFIDDVYHFMLEGKLDISVFFDVIKYLKKETDFVAWYPMFNILSYMSDFFKQSENTFVVPHMLDILDPLVEKVGYEEDPKDDDMRKSLRLLAVRWACKLGNSNCRKVANSKLNQHIMDPATYPILPWWKDWVYCTGMEMANLSIWYKVLDKSTKNKDMETLTYLTCSNETPLLVYYLDFLVLNDDAKELMTDDQRFSIYCAIVKKHAQKDMIFRHILRTHKDIMSSFGKSLTAILGDVIMSVDSSEQFDKIREFVNSTNPEKLFAIQLLIEARTKRLFQIVDKHNYF